MSWSPVNGSVTSGGPGTNTWRSGPPGIWIPPGIGLGAGSTRGSPCACAAEVMAGSIGPTVAAAPV